MANSSGPKRIGRRPLSPIYAYAPMMDEWRFRTPPHNSTRVAHAALATVRHYFFIIQIQSHVKSRISTTLCNVQANSLVEEPNLNGGSTWEYPIYIASLADKVSLSLWCVRKLRPLSFHPLVSFCAGWLNAICFLLFLKHLNSLYFRS